MRWWGGRNATTIHCPGGHCPLPKAAGFCTLAERSGAHLKPTIMAGSTDTGVPSSHFKLFWLESPASFPIEHIFR